MVEVMSKLNFEGEECANLVSFKFDKILPGAGNSVVNKV